MKNNVQVCDRSCCGRGGDNLFYLGLIKKQPRFADVLDLPCHWPLVLKGILCLRREQRRDHVELDAILEDCFSGSNIVEENCGCWEQEVRSSRFEARAQRDSEGNEDADINIVKLDHIE